MTEVHVYFDFVSPYTYLALAQLEGFGREHAVSWVVRPVVYAALLNQTGLIGPVEVEAKRAYTFADIQRSAALLNLPLEGPPAHPFRSIEALRAVCAVQGRPEALTFSVAIARAVWGQGLDITDRRELEGLAPLAGLAPGELSPQLVATETKERLRTNTEEALDAGVFGVPTFVCGRELFWGHDRLPHLAARLAGSIDSPLGKLDRFLERPRGAVRRAVPRREG